MVKKLGQMAQRRDYSAVEPASGLDAGINQLVPPPSQLTNGNNSRLRRKSKQIKAFCHNKPLRILAF